MNVKLSIDGQDGILIAQSTGLRGLRTEGDLQLQLYDKVCHGSGCCAYTILEPYSYNRPRLIVLVRRGFGLSIVCSN